MRVVGLCLLVIGLVGCSTRTPVLAVAPRWERVATLDGRTAPFAIAAHAVQWRVSASCASGRLRVERGDEVLASVSCPGQVFGFSIARGPQRIAVTGEPGWRVVVDQQVTTPTDEPPLVGMRPSTRVAAGTFYGIDQRGFGLASVYALEGRLILRLDPFRVTPNNDLYVWLSENPAPATSELAQRAPHLELGRLTATAGAQSYPIPAGLDLDAIGSVVIWCEPVRTAYAAAALRR